MNVQRPRTWLARVVLGTLLGAVVASLALLGYDPSGRPAGASFQPQPTSVAFVPLYPEPSAQAQRLGGEDVFATNMAELYAAPTVEVIDTDAPSPPAPADDQTLAQDESCSFPCVPEVSKEPVVENAEAPNEPVSEDGEAPEEPSDVESSQDIPETD